MLQLWESDINRRNSRGIIIVKYAVLVRPIIPDNPHGAYIVNCLDVHIQAVGDTRAKALMEMMRLLALNTKMANDAHKKPLEGHMLPPESVIQAVRDGAGVVMNLTVEKKSSKSTKESLF